MLQGGQRNRHVPTEANVYWLVLILIGCGESPPSPAVAPFPAPVVIEAPEPPPLADPTTKRLAASHVLITWSGAPQAPSSVTRSKAEANTLAAKLHADAPTIAAEFAGFAQQHSDGPSASRGGQLGVWLTGTMVPNFERHTAAVAPGQIAPLCETPFGFHIIRRETVVQIHARHILVSWNKAHQSGVTRSKEEARSRIEAAQASLAAGADFATIANTESDDSTAARGGDLGPVSPGQMVPAFEDAAMALKVNDISPIIETPYGFHLIQRTE